MKALILSGGDTSVHRPWAARQGAKLRDVSARWRFWRRNPENGHVAKGELEHSQLDNMDIDEHATDVVISMLEQKILGGEEAQPHLGSSFRERKQPPGQPPPMPQLSSATSVLEEQRQFLGSDPSVQERPQAPAQPHIAEGTHVHAEQPVQLPHEPAPTAQSERSDTPTMLVPSQMLQLPTVQTEMSPTPFSAACALALGILGAARLGQNEEHIEARGNSRPLALLRKRQQEKFAANQARPEDDTTSEQRIQEARLKAAEKAHREVARQKQYAAAAAKEAAEDQRRREKARKEYEEAEARKAEELARRVEVERVMLRKRREELRAAEEAAQAARDVRHLPSAPEAERQAAAKRAAQLEREGRQAVEAAQAADKERAELRKLRQTLVARAEGSAVVTKAGPGLTTSGRVKVPATIEVSAVVSNVLSGEAGPVVCGASSAADAEDISGTVAGEVASLFRKRQLDALVAQQAMGRGPLMKMNHVELHHWMNELCMAVQAAAASKLRSVCAEFSSSGGDALLMERFAIKVERGMLPEAQPKRAHALFQACVSEVQQKGIAAAPVLDACLSELSDTERPWIEDSLVAAGVTENVRCSHIADVCVAAHLVDFSETRWTGDPAEAPEWHHQIVSSAQSWLSKQTANAAPDSLLDVAEMACWALGDDHPIATHMLESADKNLSLEKKMAVVERQRALDELVAQLQAEEKLTSSEIAAQLALDKQALIPIPERIWALRNTASTMALGDRQSKAKARDIFEMALQLQHDHLQDAGHPGLLGELWRLSQLLQKEQDWEHDSVALDEQAVQILCSVVELYKAQGDTLSAALLAEATCTAFHRLTPTLDDLQLSWESTSPMFDSLAPQEKELVLEKRGTVDAVESLILMFTEELGVYSIRTGNKSHKLWAEGKLLPLVQLPVSVST